MVKTDGEPGPKKPVKGDKTARLGAALRANLQRRKAQARARKAEDDEMPKSDPPESGRD